jgi:hypothetical protein
MPRLRWGIGDDGKPGCTQTDRHLPIAIPGAHETPTQDTRGGANGQQRVIHDDNGGVGMNTTGLSAGEVGGAGRCSPP